MIGWRRMLWGAAAIAAMAGPASACLNDRAVNQAEAEFRSRYEQPAPAPPGRPMLWGVDMLGLVAMAAGGGLIAASTVRVLRRRG